MEMKARLPTETVMTDEQKQEVYAAKRQMICAALLDRHKNTYHYVEMLPRRKGTE